MEDDQQSVVKEGGRNALEMPGKCDVGRTVHPVVLKHDQWVRSLDIELIRRLCDAFLDHKLSVVLHFQRQLYPAHEKCLFPSYHNERERETKQ